MECFPGGGWRLRDVEDEDLHEGYEEVVLACCVAVWLAGCQYFYNGLSHFLIH